MADKRISQLIERTDIANNDVVPIVAFGASTTNKATISSIQTYMQENLDVGVTSVGITLGTTGTNINVTGSPITTSGNITINIPDASATARGVVNTGTQTFAGIKSFNGTIVVNQDLQLAQAGTALTTFIKNINGTGLSSFGSNGFGFNNSNNVYFSGSNKGGGVLAFSNTGTQIYTLQDASGTLAFTSDISTALAGYVTLATAQTITAQKTFTTSGATDSVIISQGSGSGIALDVIKAGSGQAIRVQKTSGGGDAVTITGGRLLAENGTFTGQLSTLTGGHTITLTSNLNGTTNRIESSARPLEIVTAGSAITLAAGGTTPQFTLAGSGAVTLTGALNGTSAVFSGAVVADSTDGGTIFLRTAGANVGLLTSTFQILGSGSKVDLNAFVYGANDFGVWTNSTKRLTITSSGNVGIGTATPSQKLHIGGVGSALAFDTTGQAGSSIIQTISDFVLSIRNNRGTSSEIRVGNENIEFFTSNTERMRITSGGALLVNRTSTISDITYKFAVKNTTDVNIAFGIQGGEASIESFNDAVSAGKPLRIYAETLKLFANGNEAMRINSQSQMIVGDTGMTFGNSQGYVAGFKGGSASQTFVSIARSGQALSSQGFMIGLDANFCYLYNHDNTPMTFVNNAVERMRLTSGGNLIVGDSSTDNTGKFSYASPGVGSFNGVLQLFHSTSNISGSGFVNFYVNTSVIGSIGQLGTTAVVYNTTSDYRLKEDLQEVKGLEKVQAIKVYDYKWITDDFRMDGVLAHELAEVLPYAVTGEKDELNEDGTDKMQGVDYSKIVPILIKAIQELKTEIDSLKNQMQ